MLPTLYIREHRLAKSLTQVDLAAIAKMDQSQLSAIERGRWPSRENLARLAEALGIEPEDLFRPPFALRPPHIPP